MARSRTSSEGLPQGGGTKAWTDRLQAIDDRAQQDLEEGAVTAGYRADREEVIDLLNRALAGEWASFLQYWHHYTMASDIHSAEIREQWKEHAEDEYEHARQFMERIKQLGGVPANDPSQIVDLNPSPFTAGHDLRSMIEADLVGERAAIEFYNDVVRLCGFDDNETRTIFEEILLEENHHADELADFLFQYDASTGEQITTVHQKVARGGTGAKVGAKVGAKTGAKTGAVEKAGLGQTRKLKGRTGTTGRKQGTTQRRRAA